MYNWFLSNLYGLVESSLSSIVPCRNLRLLRNIFVQDHWIFLEWEVRQSNFDFQCEKNLRFSANETLLAMGRLRDFIIKFNEISFEIYGEYFTRSQKLSTLKAQWIIRSELNCNCFNMRRRTHSFYALLSTQLWEGITSHYNIRLAWKFRSVFTWCKHGLVCIRTQLIHSAEIHNRASHYRKFTASCFMKM